MLTAVSNFWFAHTHHVVPNHLQLASLNAGGQALLDPAERAAWSRDRAVVARRLKGLPVEAIVRGYLIGSGWKDYQRDGRGVRHSVCPTGLRLGGSPAGAAVHSLHQGGAGHPRRERQLRLRRRQCHRTRNLAERVQTLSLRTVSGSSRVCSKTRGIIIADTKFEFGLDESRTAWC
jgi:phosphoribosylaminoimidazole-succinocarboxamide synthase